MKLKINRIYLPRDILFIAVILGVILWLITLIHVSIQFLKL